ncbi:Uncharacterized protein APZ42_011911 [Daphnia magna]|uniref:Uncharacterized protein n=1 Tax=Daphnia magna TaxID=35525 RepID=A0A162CYI5_9CRUS|nr:Uncharacterized protein APZ42_011911 [Daphnia magna]
MPQGRIKVKTAMPTNVKGKKVKKLDKVPPKRKVQHNPIGPRKVQIMEAKQMRKNISKTINQTLEDRLVSQVSQDGKPLAVIGRKAAQEAKAEKGKKGKK